MYRGSAPRVGRSNAVQLWLKPDLAESYEVSPDGKVFTFKLRHGVKFSNGEDFDAEAASTRDVLVSRVLNWGETIGTLTKNGLLDTDLVLDWLWLAGVWKRVEPAARKSREEAGVAELYENFEALAAKQGS